MKPEAKKQLEEMGDKYRMKANVKPEDLDFKIGSPEEVFLTAELENNERALEIHKKAIEAIKWLDEIYKGRIKEIAITLEEIENE